MNPLHKTINGVKHYLLPPATYLPCLSKEELDKMWPNAQPVKSTKKDWRKQDSTVVNLVRENYLKADGDLTGIPEMGKPVAPEELEVVMNILGAPERIKDNVVLPEHYARFKIEPIRFSIENNLNGFQFNIVKYILRHDAKNGIEDLKKAKRYLEMFIKFMEGDEDWWKA